MRRTLRTAVESFRELDRMWLPSDHLRDVWPGVRPGWLTTDSTRLMVGAGTAEVEAVDLQVGQQIRFDITTEWMRVHLFADGCGNSVARLVANLRHHSDSWLTFVDDDLDAHLRPTPVPSG